MKPSTPLARDPADTLVGLGIFQFLLYLFLFALSFQFVLYQSQQSRPILLVLFLLSINFLVYLLSLHLCFHADSSKTRLTTLVFAFGIAFRLPMLFSTPIQEIDIYRYLWDGNVSTSGVNPYRYSPLEVENTFETSDEDLTRLVQLKQSTPALQAIFSRVHFKEVPTVYPPASQVVFALASLLTPKEASVGVHLFVMKFVLLLFDIGTFIVLAALLKRLSLPPAWSLAYGWCPLILKEFANSGHLDSIAVFFTTVTVYLVIPRRGRSLNLRTTLFAGVTWGIGILAKFYPIVLAPVLLRWLTSKLGWKACVPLAAALLTVLIGYLPFHIPSQKPVLPATPQTRDSFEGLRTFLGHWEMNDMIFGFVVANLDPPSLTSPTPWYSILPNSLRETINDASRNALERVGWEITSIDVPFVVAQSIVGCVLVCICLWLAVKGYDCDKPELVFLKSTFLCLAWTWYLSATQNPWYWSWALPFVVFARGAWLWTAGLAMTYYLRFWLEYHFSNRPIVGNYTGPLFFHHIIVWLEHAPVLLALLCTRVFRKRDG